MIEIDDHSSTKTADLSVRFDDAGRLQIVLSGDFAELTKLQVRLNARRWASIPTHLDSASPIRRRICTCDLPPLPEPAESEVIELIDPGTTGLVDRFVLGKREAKLNGYGLKASEAYDGGSSPLYAAIGMKLEGTLLTIAGSHLPPLGDPSRLGVMFGPGVSYAFENSMPSPEFAAHYWYWPNADYSGFRITINLAACLPASDPFAFQFVHTQDEGEASEGGSFYILSDFAAMVGFPSDLTQLTRVQSYDRLDGVAFQSYNVYRSLAELLVAYGIRPRPGLTLLDWGCGHGRIARHFLQNWRGCEIWGMDIDGENIGWCKQRFSDGVFVHGPLLPPSPLPAEAFDAVFAISVMTHLTAYAQEAWLGELARVLKPHGVAMLTFSGQAAAAFSSIFRDVAWWSDWRKNGFNDAQIDPALNGKIDSATYYRNTLQSVENVQETWSDWFEIIAIEPHRFGYQDVAVMRKRVDV
jgi:ubiquinone/menaquinone biosynthesis C-methylase UbiE